MLASIGFLMFLLGAAVSTWAELVSMARRV